MLWLHMAQKYSNRQGRMKTPGFDLAHLSWHYPGPVEDRLQFQ
jgi:hypothetical protein